MELLLDKITYDTDPFLYPFPSHFVSVVDISVSLATLNVFRTSRYGTDIYFFSRIIETKQKSCAVNITPSIESGASGATPSPPPLVQVQVAGSQQHLPTHVKVTAL